MTGRMYIQGNDAELLIGNRVFDANSGETIPSFESRVKKELKNEFGSEIDIVRIDLQELEKFPSEMLMEVYRSAKGKLQRTVVEGLLTKRGVDVSGLLKPVRSTLPARTKEEARASKEYKDAYQNVGRYAWFTVPKTGERVFGKITDITFNKKNTALYYSWDVMGKFRSCSVNYKLEFVKA